MNISINLYFSLTKRTFNDIRCKNGIIMHMINTYYNNFNFTKFFIFLVDTIDYQT